jgi:hypothetical protein
MNESTIETKQQVLGHLKMEAYAKLIAIDKLTKDNSMADYYILAMRWGRLTAKIEKIETTELPSYIKGNPERESQCKWIVSEDRSIILPVYLGN